MKTFLVLFIGLLSLQNCFSQSAKQLLIYENDDYFVFGVQNDDVYFYLQKNSNQNSGEQSTYLKGDFYLTEYGMQVVLEDGVVYKLKIDQDLTKKNMFCEAIFGTNYSTPKEAVYPLYADSDPNVKMVAGNGIGVIYTDVAPNVVPQELNCKCLVPGVDDSKCIAGGEGSISGELNSSKYTSGITCNNKLFACCKE